MGLLDGKKLLITGALDEKSIAWKVAERSFEEGAQIVLTNAPAALRFGKVKELAEKINAPIIPADATNLDDLNHLIDKTLEHFGGPFDGLLHSIGMSPNIRKKREYTNLNYDFYMKTLDISAISLHKMLQVCWEKDALAEGASVIALSYIAAQRVFPKYGDMADAKALLESIVRNFGYWYGKRKKVRINAVSQSPTYTTAGSSVPGFDAFFNYADTMSPLGNADADDCADFCIALFSDLTRKVTMHTIFHDGGFHATGVSVEIMTEFENQNQ